MAVADWAAILFITDLVCLLFGSITPLFAIRHQRLANLLAHSSALVAGMSGSAAAVAVLLSKTSITITAWQIMPGFVWRFQVDALSAFFLLVISMILMPVAVYSTGYVTKYEGKKNIAYLGALLNLFALSMIAVVTVSSAFTFLIAWEIMSVVSFLLVMFEHEKSQVRASGYIYLVMTHIATAFITLSFLIMFRYTQSFDFAVYQQLLRSMPVLLQNGIFVMCLIGFGAKAGVIPLHVWLPRAHPVAPSNISALMSGVMIKTALYGLIRIVFDFFGGGQAWWGTVLLVVGLISALWGILLALTENDLKRFLAYSSTENIGIILVGVGGALLFQAHQLPLLGAVALTAALFHILSHAWLKGLLFMGAGSVLYATHTKNMNELGGLIRRMPWTAGLFLIGGMSLAALPPFSGVISEWLILQSMLHVIFDLPGFWFKIGGAVAVGLLALTGAFAAGGVIKQFGISFLAMPRTKAAANAVEVPLSMRFGMGMLALPIVLCGLLPGTVVTLTSSITTEYFAQTLSGTAFLLLPFHEATGGESLSIAWLAAAFVLVCMIGLALLKWKLGSCQVVVDETWNCGSKLEPSMEYSGTSYSHPLVMIFQKLIGINRKVAVEREYRYYPKRITHELTVNANIEAVLYKPLISIMLYLSQRMRTIQDGNLQNYLAYMVGALVIALIWSR